MNCKVSGSQIVGTGGASNYIGGIVGTSGVSLELTGCENRITNISGVMDVGGIIGRHVTGSLLITDCYNYGTVMASKQYAGGVLGSAVYSPDLRIANCENRGVIKHDDPSCTNPTYNSSGGVGGIASVIGTADGSISGCLNYGSIKSHCFSGGGIIGFLNGIADAGNYTGKIVDPFCKMSTFAKQERRTVIKIVWDKSIKNHNGTSAYINGSPRSYHVGRLSKLYRSGL